MTQYPKWPNDRVTRLVEELSVEEKAALMAGIDMWTTAAVAGAGIPSFRMTDGPAGARGPGADVRSPSAALPCGIALGSTWDRELLVELGEVLAHQARSKGARILLAPTINLHRSPLGGRVFESFSEDPILTGELAAAVIRGVQALGVGATAKHFVGNEAESDRFVSNSVIDERTLRELYLVPFELAVRKGGVLAVMTGYNRLNGDWCSEDQDLLGILRDEWGFEGFVVSDWFGIMSTDKSLEAGVDVEMPGPARTYGKHLAESVRSGRTDESLLDRSVARILSVADHLGALDDGGPGPEQSIDLPEHRNVLRRALWSSAVLLKNEQILPFDPTKIRTLAVLGPNANHAQIMGGGSATLEPHYRVTPLEAIQNRLGNEMNVIFEPGCDTTVTLPALEMELSERFFDASGNEVLTRRSNTTRLRYFGAPSERMGDRWSVVASGSFVPESGGPWEFGLVQSGRARVIINGEVVVDGVTNPPALSSRVLGFGTDQLIGRVVLSAGEPVDLTIELSNESAPALVGALVGGRPVPPGDLMERAVEAAEKADAVVVIVGTNDDWESEGHDRSSMRLPGDQDELVRHACAANSNTVVILNAGSPLELPWADEAPAILNIWFGGQEMSDGLVDLLIGTADPGGRLPTTYPLRLEHTPAFGNYPGSNGEVRYGEGLLMGYRWYDTRHLPVRFPFGHGLSYTNFDTSEPVISLADQVVIETTITNIGDRAGTDVLQVYVEPVDPPVDRPRKELKAFEKVTLDPNESTTVRFALDDRAFSYWSPDPTDYEAAKLREDGMQVSTAPAQRKALPQPGWTYDEGLYLVHIGRSVSDIVHTLEIQR